MLDAAIASGHHERRMRLRGLRPPTARGTPLRRRRGHGATARPHRRVPFRLRRTRLAARAAGGQRAHPRLARRLPVLRVHPRLPGGRGVLPRLPRPRRARAVSPRRDARDARAQRAQLRLRGRDGGQPHGFSCGRSARSPRWARVAPTRMRRSRPPEPPTSPGSAQRATLRPAAAGASRRWAPPRTRSRCLHDSEEEAFEAQVAALGSGTTLLVDTYDIAAGVEARRQGRRHRSRRGAHRLAATSPNRWPRCAPSSIRSAPPRRGSP